MAISAQAVKQLRERTGAGMMDCKQALVEAEGDLEQAIKVLRAKGLSAAAKKAHRATNEGLVVIAGDARRMALLELNSETDFVARNDRFRELANTLGQRALALQVEDATSLLRQSFADGQQETVEQVIAQNIGTIGENLVLSRCAVMTAAEGNRLSSYLHMGGKIGVLVEGTSAVSEEALHDVAMHIAAADPRFVRRDQVTGDVLAAEREIALKQVLEQGKPEKIAQRIVDGKMEKFFSQAVLLEQPFAKDPDRTVGRYLRDTCGEDALIVGFVRYRLGEE